MHDGDGRAAEYSVHYGSALERATHSHPSSKFLPPWCDPNVSIAKALEKALKVGKERFMARQRLTTRSRQNDGDDAMRCEVVFKSSFDDNDDNDDDDERDDRDEVENLMKTGADVQQMQRRVRTLKRSLSESTSREEALRRNYAALSGAHAKLKEEFENTMRDLQSTKKERERLVDNERRKAKEVAVLTKEVGHRERSDAEAAELRVKYKQMVRTNASCMNATHDSPVIIGDEGRRGHRIYSFAEFFTATQN